MAKIIMSFDVRHIRGHFINSLYEKPLLFIDDVAGGTKLIFSQKEIPAHKVDALKEGWKLYYWQPMKA